MVRRVFGTFGFLAAIAASACGPSVGQLATPIESDQEAEETVPRFEGAAADARPLPDPGVPQHPFMGPNGLSSMHADGPGTNVHPQAGPLGRNPIVDSDSLGVFGGECASIQFDRFGRAVTVCVNLRQPVLVLLDPQTLRVIDLHDLPRRHTPLVHLREMMDDTSGGSYFYIDEQNRAVIGTPAGTIEIVEIRQGGGEHGGFEHVTTLDVREPLALEHGHDKITSVMPDWEGRLWFAARLGTVGFVNRDGTGARSIRLEEEEIENSFSVGPDAVYIVSDHALYRFEVGEDGGPEVVWREEYDRGLGRKVGQINRGSGTTPTLLGDDFVAIADNAESRMNVVVYRRGEVEGDRKVCEVPVFDPGFSATENGLIGYGRSLIVENNADYDIFRTMREGRTSSGGIVRVDIDEDGGGCSVVWRSAEISQTTVPKLSTATGLVYLYTKRPDTPNHIDAYYFTAIDFRTGETVFRVLTGVGTEYDNNWGAISFSPTGAAFVGVLNGLLKITDLTPEAATP